MIDHLGLGVSDYDTSKAFFLKALAPLGVTIVMEGTFGVGLGMNGKPTLWLHITTEQVTPLHLAFAAQSRKQVQQFYGEAIAAGGKDNGTPGVRPQYHANYYAAFVIAPDGHNIEAVCHKPET